MSFWKEIEKRMTEVQATEEGFLENVYGMRLVSIIPLFLAGLLTYAISMVLGPTLDWPIDHAISLIGVVAIGVYIWGFYHLASITKQRLETKYSVDSYKYWLQYFFSFCWISMCLILLFGFMGSLEMYKGDQPYLPERELYLSIGSFLGWLIAIGWTASAGICFLSPFECTKCKRRKKK